MKSGAIRRIREGFRLTRPDFESTGAMMKAEVHPLNIESHPAKTELVLYGTDFHLLEELKRFSVDMPYVFYEPGYGPQVVIKAGLDALWASPMAGVELFGATPPWPIHEA